MIVDGNTPTFRYAILILSIVVSDETLDRWLKHKQFDVYSKHLKSSDLGSRNGRR